MSLNITSTDGTRSAVISLDVCCIYSAWQLAKTAIATAILIWATLLKFSIKRIPEHVRAGSVIFSLFTVGTVPSDDCCLEVILI